MKKRIVSGFMVLAIAVAGVCILPGCGGGASGSSDKVQIVWGNYGSSSMPIAKGDYDAVEYIEETSGGTIEIAYSPDGVLGGEADMMQQIMDGTIQAANISPSTLSTYTELLDVLQLPFLIGDYDTEREALTSEAAQALYDEVGNELGLKIVAASVSENGMRHFMTKNKAIETVDDMKGLKLRIVPNNMLTKVMQNLGASPQSIAYADVYSALQNNVIDGEEINVTSAYAMKHYEQLGYLSEIGMYPFPCIIVYNLNFWNSLTEEQQQIIEDGHKLASDHIFDEYLPAYEEESYAALKEAGIQINTISDEAREEFVERAKPIWEEYKDLDPLCKDFIEYVESLN